MLNQVKPISDSDSMMLILSTPDEAWTDAVDAVVAHAMMFVTISIPKTVKWLQDGMHTVFNTVSGEGECLSIQSLALSKNITARVRRIGRHSFTCIGPMSYRTAIQTFGSLVKPKDPVE
ncbi:hypothetical protein ADUPG1_007319 [Aduncisulcus paluster]|uniref:Uncharacterized protein n=1 Tax=Aduncisulcus paluster TaxID=2918883 RepID=A0ABQ5KLL1_9EUKA|nr:hypothetical protein ADUPG1_007319 [Aduncisulcus paluster]